LFLLSLLPLRPRSTLFPYTTLFRSPGARLAPRRPRILITRVKTLLLHCPVLVVDLYRSGAQLHVVPGLAEDIFSNQRLKQRAFVAFLAQNPAIIFMSDVVVLHAASWAESNGMSWSYRQRRGSPLLPEPPR